MLLKIALPILFVAPSFAQSTASTAPTSAVAGTQAHAHVMAGKKKVDIAFKQIDSMTVEAQIVASGFTAKEIHGLHIHEGTICEGPGYKSAGSHFNPHKKEHGSPSSESHAGDLGNVEGDKKGKFKAKLTLSQIQIAQGESGILGRAVILHAKADDLKTQPTGDSGDRVGCAIIQAQ